jgi:hypothetical protein
MPSRAFFSAQDEYAVFASPQFHSLVVIETGGAAVCPKRLAAHISGNATFLM